MRAPTKRQLDLARKKFVDLEPRDHFYKITRELICLSLKCKTSITLSEAIYVLLRKWNKDVFRYKKFEEEDLVILEKNIENNREFLKPYYSRSIKRISTESKSILVCIFQDFENPRGPVSAAKTLHLLAPKYFPMWDREIAEGYKIRFGRKGTNGLNYLKFMEMVLKQVRKIKQYTKRDVLKRLDEFNYCKFTKGIKI
jgi:hypothetical protein